MEKLNQEQNKNQELLTTIRELSKESLMLQDQINFLLNQESQLLGNQANIEAIKE